MVSWAVLVKKKRKPMRTGLPKSPIMLSKEEHEQLRAMASFRSLWHDLINRVRIVLMAVGRFPNLQVANQVYLSPQSVYCRKTKLLRQEALMK
jgi:hypothetical protein